MFNKLNNVPFYGKHITNGCFLTQPFVYIMIGIFGEKMLILALFWMLLFSCSIIADKYFYDN
jgi:hypothetical protein